MNKLDFGIFLPNTSGALIFGASYPPESLPSFKVNREVTRMAEDASFDYVLSQVKWRGFGGRSQHWDNSLEAFTLLSALAATSSKIQLYASVAIRTIHPVVIAKMATTIDDISQGRFGVNIVSGWNKIEYDQMGLWDEDAYYNYRYTYAEEYMQVLRELWQNGVASFDGRFFQLKDCLSLPKPPRPLPIVCAGQSDEGVAFTAKYADYAFVGAMQDDIGALTRQRAKVDQAAAANGRSVGSYVLMTVIAEETDAAALAKRDKFAENADQDAINNWMGFQKKDPNKAGREHDKRTAVHRAFLGVHLIAGSYQTVAAHMDALADGGLRGVCLAFPDYIADLPRFIDKVLPHCKSYRPTL